jgi:hypothetical protein
VTDHRSEAIHHLDGRGHATFANPERRRQAPTLRPHVRRRYSGEVGSSRITVASHLACDVDVRRRCGCSVALGLKKRVPRASSRRRARAPLRRRASSDLQERAHRTIVCDVDVRRRCGCDVCEPRTSETSSDATPARPPTLHRKGGIGAKRCSHPCSVAPCVRRHCGCDVDVSNAPVGDKLAASLNRRKP